MLPTTVVRASLGYLVVLGTASAVMAASARETVYFTTPNNTISRADLVAGTAQAAVVDNGTNFNGLVVRYDGNDVVTLLAANGPQGGDVRAYRCTSAAAPCQSLGAVFALKKAQGVALDTFGNLYAVSAGNGAKNTGGGGDQLVFAARKPGCPTDTGVGLPAGCFPGGYGPVQVIDSLVDGANEVADVKVEAQSGDVIVLASKPGKLLRYAADDVQARVEGGAEPTPSPVPGSLGGETPSGLALFPTGEMFVVTRQGTVLVVSGGSSSVFTTLGGAGAQVATSVEGGAASDPVASGRVLVTGNGQVASFGLARASGQLVASPSAPDGSVGASTPFGVADASLGGSVYTPASATPLVVHLPLGHEVTFEKVVSGGLTQGNYYVVLESSVRAAPAVGSCGPGEALTLEGLTRCLPSYVRGYPLNGSTCLNNGTGAGCYYLVFVADTGANVFGSTQQHHFEEDAFGFSTNCYGAGPYFPPDPKQPRTFHGTDANDAPVVEGEDVFDITTGCGSHIGRGGQFSVFVTGWDSRTAQSVTTDKLVHLQSALVGTNALVGGLAPYINPYLLGNSTKKNTLANDIYLARQAWSCGDKAKTIAYLDSFIARIKAALPVAGKFTECPVGLPCRNAPGELIARAESAAFLACGAKQGCQRVLP
jgi:hypothetical protein